MSKLKWAKSVLIVVKYDDIQVWTSTSENILKFYHANRKKQINLTVGLENSDKNKSNRSNFYLKL